MSPILLALLGTGFTFLATVLGAATVFLFRKDIPHGMQRAFLGFAAGVMIAASVWSLLIPAMEMAQEAGQPGWLPAGGGFVLGGLFLLLLDRLLPHLHPGSDEPEGVKTSFARTTMLVLAVTLHNIPEGLAVGVAFGSLLYGLDGATLAAACMLALGIGIQNFPEGAAISLPLLRDGASKRRAFMAGMLSGAVEPIAGVIGALLVLRVRAALPYMLAFAGGAMIYVVVEELIPESHRSGKPGKIALFTLAGFALMMVLDVALSI